ncbi:MAG: hypothetical protein DRR19_11685 [Candidatus Parabeggiatoa sp. nov. 1]|nr:MAG: hypothetical protein DRR19_11685 [Gammaproteobacteria bacterium]
MNKNVSLVFFTLITSSISASNVFAEGIQEGATAVGINGSLTRMSVGTEDTDMLILGVNFSKYFTKNHEVGIQTVGFRVDSGDNGSSFVFFDGTYNYNLTSTSNVVPYFGGAGGLLYSSGNGETETYPQLGVQAGIKSFLSDDVYINTELRYRHTIAGESDLDQLSINIGLNLIF